MAEDEPVRRLDFGVSDEEARMASLPCGGNISVALFRPKLDLLTRLAELQAARVPAALTLDLETGEQALETDDTAGGAVRPRIDQGVSGIDGESLFVRVHDPELRLVVVGAVHVTQALCALAAVLGIAVVVVDPRRSFATPERFPGVTVMARQPEVALDDIRLDARTAVVALAHVPHIDDAALLRGLASPAFYVGALGSRRSHAKRLQRLAGLGASEEALSRIHAPVGLDIGAATPAEIALSVVAEVVAARRGKARPRLVTDLPLPGGP
jgi:xanthine dehydrogenase accessory factor